MSETHNTRVDNLFNVNAERRGTLRRVSCSDFFPMKIGCELVMPHGRPNFGDSMFLSLRCNLTPVVPCHDENENAMAQLFYFKYNVSWKT